MSTNDGTGLPAPKTIPASHKKEWHSQDRAWAPELDHFMGSPATMCKCGQQRQSHIWNSLAGRHEGSTDKRCAMFEPAPDGAGKMPECHECGRVANLIIQWPFREGETACCQECLDHYEAQAQEEDAHNERVVASGGMDGGNCPRPSIMQMLATPPAAAGDDQYTCSKCSTRTSAISPLGQPGVIICEDCASPRRRGLEMHTHLQQAGETPRTELLVNLIDNLRREGGVHLNNPAFADLYDALLEYNGYVCGQLAKMAARIAALEAEARGLREPFLILRDRFRRMESARRSVADGWRGKGEFRQASQSDTIADHYARCATELEHVLAGETPPQPGEAWIETESLPPSPGVGSEII